MKTRLLRIYLVVFGLACVVTMSPLIPALMFPGKPIKIPNLFDNSFPAAVMLSALYLAMGLVMLLAARRPAEHKAFLDFVVVSSVLHALVMIAYKAPMQEQGLSVGAHGVLHSVVMMGAMGVAPLFFYPWGLKQFLRYSSSPSR